MRLVLIHEIPEDTNLRREWNTLASSVPQPQVFYTYEWSLAVHRAYGTSLQTLLVLAYDERDTLRGVVALAIDGTRNAHFLCGTTGDYCDFLSEPEHKAEFVTSVLAELRRQRIGNVTFTNLPADSETVAALRKAARTHGYQCFARTAYFCARIVLADLEWRPDNQPVLPRRKMVRRFLAALGREEPVRLDHARSWADVEPILPAFTHAHIARFLFTDRISNMVRPERRLFLSELAKLLGESGWLTLTRMMSGPRTYAWNYGFQFQDTWFWYQPTFASELEKYSPGFCSLVKLVEEAARQPELKVVDLGLGAEEYKDRFANQTRETLYVTLKSSPLQHYREAVRFYASDIVRKSPKLEKGVRSLVERASQIRQHIARCGIVGAVPWAARRLRELIWLRSEVFFYEFESVARSSKCRLHPLDLGELASAATQYCDDRETLSYLLRAASRLRAGAATGYALVDESGTFLHFAWTVPFDGFFLSELNAKVDAPSPECVMLFDCWTPPSVRGHGYYAETISQIAAQVCEAGRRPWIFSAGSNLASVRGVEKAGFRRRYSLVRHRMLGWQRILGKTPVSPRVPVEEVSARV